LEPQTDVPIAALVHEVVTRVITRGGFGRRFVAKKEADAILEQLKAAAVIPIIKEVSPEVRDMIQRARQVPEQREATTAVTDDPVLFDKMVAAWAAENHQPSHEASLMLSKTTRFIRWLKLDRHERRVADLAEDMRLVTRDEFVRYKEYLLSHSKGSRNEPPKELPATGLGYTSVCRHLHDLKTIFIFASKNRSFESPTDEVTLPSRTKKMMARNKWRSFSREERFLILTEARKEGPVIRWCQWVAWATGARVSEIAEASTKDICQIGGMWCIKILLDNRDGEAELKNEDSWRIVALHSAVLREGFLDYVQEIRRKYGEGPLFPMIKPNRDGRRGTPASNRVSIWLRNKLKITDPKIAPNHSWRHTFETVHRNEMEPPTRLDIMKSIMGHSQGSDMSAHYGEFEIRRDRIEIEKMPCPV
jgi:integrase